jgi:alpha-tubulin suppressor-like RCC1 family protein
MVAALTMMAVATPASATSSGTFAWGWNHTGQLGTGGTFLQFTLVGYTEGTDQPIEIPEIKPAGDESLVSLGPVGVGGLSGVTAISAGDGVSLAVVNGKVMAWGSNGVGTLGTGNTITHPVNPGPQVCQGTGFCSTVPVPVVGLPEEVTAVSAQGEQSLALLKKGETVMEWGRPVAGCSAESREPKYVPVPVGGLPKEVTAISAGADFNLALLKNGTVMEWGTNLYGELGISTGPEDCGGEPYSSVPVEVPKLPHEVVAISAGGEHSLALLKDGTVMAWGKNDSGQLDNGSVTNEAAKVSGLSGVTAISAGYERSLALSKGTMSKGKVMAWPGPSGVPVEVSGLSGLNEEVTAISTGGTHSLALLSGGKVWAWGSNGLGELGNGTKLDSAEPVEVSGLSGITGIAAGFYDSMAFTASVPTVLSVTPSTGPGAGGASVTITGANLSEVTAVKFGLTPATSFTVNSASITAVAPGGTGTVDVTVASSEGTSATSSADHYTYLAPPTVSTVTPNLGPTAGGTLVTITGAELTFATGVRFGATPAVSFIVNSATSMTAIAPAGTGTVDVTVTTPGGTSTTGSVDHYRYVPPPTVKKVTPTKGSAAGATTVTIAGTELSGATAVKFGSASATRFTVVSATSITAIAPPGTTGSMVDVTVTTAGGKSAITSADHYSYVAPAPPTVTKLSPTKGLAGGGTSVTISGTEFGGATAVTFGSASAVSFTVNSALSLTASSSAGTAKTVDVTVTTPSGISAISSNDHFQLGPPTITSISPHAGSAVGGSTVTISGTGFGLGPEATAFSFGSTVATSVNCTAMTTCTVVVPSHVAGTVDVKATVSGMISLSGSGDQYTYN